MKTLQKDLTTGNPGKIIFNFTADLHWKCISAVLQYGRYDYRRKVRGNQSTCGCWKYGNDHVSDQWIYTGNDGRIYRTYGTEIWRG